MAQYFYDKQVRRYIQQFIRLFSGFNVQMGKNEEGLPVYQEVPVRYGDINRMAAHITRENSENIVNTVPFISCYVTDLNMMPERRTYQQHVEKVQVSEKKYDEETGAYLNEVGNKYTIERYAPVPYKLVMNCDIWTSNTDQKLQLLEQILILFNPTLDIRTTDNPFDWSSLAYVEMTNSIWSSRSVTSNIDDIIDVSTLTFEMPILVNPPAKVKQQKIIHTLINQLYSLDDEDLDNFRSDLPFDNSSLQYTVVTFEDMKLRYQDGKAYILNAQGTNLDDEGNPLTWEKQLRPFGELRDGISQIRLRKSNNPGNPDNDIIGRLSESSDPGALDVIIDEDTLPSNTINPITGIVNPQKNYPGDGVMPAASIGQRYLITQDLPQSNNWNLSSGDANDIIEFNGSIWAVAFDSDQTADQQYTMNLATGDQYEWNGSEWFNSYEGVYTAGYWRLYL